ncbi:DUF2087 domain-containing protein [Caldibacillus lycopersici]|uniref:DUF2087 domain-containing protein n=1 Tax=Perspicuibacillus lycopersici TaxID=1325689 RepID=A0AAE3LMG0_9BACI|nr:DUF2087 domain-containing protein [Perspicuibacillus lycopersici]MCU9613540.1 DUF2087 domain-containing protein [Perspicuibacillus lycopersici]
MMDKDEQFWNASVEELAKGYIYEEEKSRFVCLMCQESFLTGVIYPFQHLLLEAKRAIEAHIELVHHSMFDYLVNLDKKYTGLSDLQKELVISFREGLSDKDIVSKMDGGSTSTIRNHRFKLKEKEKQAKVFLALMSLLKDEKEIGMNEFIQIHKGAKMVDDRYAITKEEKEKVLATYFKNGLDGGLHTFPSKEKRKIIILQHILQSFEPNRIYTEREVNEILKKFYQDFVTIRRALIEYGFMERSNDGSGYWLKG